MDLLKKNSHHLYLYVTSSHLIWFGEALKEPLSFELAADILKDMEISNLKSLENHLMSLIDQKTILPQALTICLGPELYFDQVITSQDPNATEQFKAIIPFDDKVSKTIQQNGQSHLVTVSQDLLSPLISVLIQCGFTIRAVYPHLAIAAYIPESGQLSVEVAKAIGKNSEALLPLSFYERPKTSESSTSIRHADGSILSKELIAMIGVFAVLIGVLIYLLFKQGFLGGSSQAIPVAPPPAPESELMVPEVVDTTSTVSPTASISATPAAVDYQINIQLLANSQELADQIQESFRIEGFENITTGLSETTAQNTVIFVSPEVDVLTRQAILQVLSEQQITGSFQENSELEDVAVRIIVVSSETNP